MYGLLFVGILIVPEYWNFFEVGISFFEAYCIYCFYKMLKFHIGNKQDVVAIIQESDYTGPCCTSCQKNTPNCCYKVVEGCLVQFFTLRPLLFLFLAILERSSYDGPLLQLLTVSTVISLIVAMISLLRAYNYMIDRTVSLMPTQKVLFIKGIILIMVIQNLVVTSQQETGLFAKASSGDMEEE